MSENHLPVVSTEKLMKWLSDNPNQTVTIHAHVGPGNLVVSRHHIYRDDEWFIVDEDDADTIKYDFNGFYAIWKSAEWHVEVSPRSLVIAPPDYAVAYIEDGELDSWEYVSHAQVGDLMTRFTGIPDETWGPDTPYAVWSSVAIRDGRLAVALPLFPELIEELE